MKDLKVKVQEIPIEQLAENVGQIPDVPANPRRITDEAFELLKKSIDESPEMREIDEVKVFQYEGKFVAIGGNHRLRAYKELGWKKVLCKVIPKADGKILGISKIARVVGYCGARLQLQERLARDIVEMLTEALDGYVDGMAIVMRGTHMCKSMRGVKNQGMMTVAHLSGVFKEDEMARREFYKLIDLQ